MRARGAVGGVRAALPASPVPLWRPVRARPSDFFSPDEVARSKAYQRPLQYARLLVGAVDTAASVAFIWTKAGPRLLDALGIGAWPLQLVVIIFAFSFVTGLVMLPVEIWVEFRHERDWGFSTQTPKRFAADQLKSLLLFGLVLQAALFIPVWALIRSVDAWWIWGAVVLTLFTVVLSALFPVVIMPVFNTFTPLEDLSLRERLVGLARKAGVHVADFFVMDASKRSRKDNAFFAGAGKTRRIVLYDNLLQMPPDQVEVVVGHELGHWRRGHQRSAILLGLVENPLMFGAIGALMSWDPALRWAGVREAGDPAAFPLFLGGFVGAFFATRYVSMWFARWFERQADLDALELTGNVQAYSELWRNMTERNLPDLDPSWWRRVKGNHPPIAERMAFASVWERSKVNGASP